MEWMNAVRSDHNLPRLCGFVSRDMDYKNTKLYDYIINHPNREEISNIFTDCVIANYRPNNIFFGIPSGIVYAAYKILFDKNFFDIIYEIIDGSNSCEEFIICMVAIENNNYDVLNFAISKGLDIRKIDKIIDTDLLQYAVFSKNLDVCKYFINAGASPIQNNCRALIQSVFIELDNILEYFLQLDDIKNEHLETALIAGCFLLRHTDKKKFLMIIERGIDLNGLDQKFFDSVGYCDVDTFKFLLENGLELNSNILLGSACINNNVKVIKLCLESGLRPNDAILENVLHDFCIPTIKLFLQYNVDFSSIPVVNEYDNIIAEFEKNGIDQNNLLNMMFRLIDPNYQSLAHIKKI